MECPENSRSKKHKQTNKKTNTGSKRVKRNRIRLRERMSEAYLLHRGRHGFKSFTQHF